MEVDLMTDKTYQWIGIEEQMPGARYASVAIRWK